jgi:NAD(P)H-hydrate repair Nnr-like enzyme with NAD(P)H-hydrate dehydratase domain
MNPPIRPWLVAGTIPDADFPLTLAPCSFASGILRLGDIAVPVNRGTPSLVAAALITFARLGEESGKDSLLTLAAGDTGRGEGSFAVYKALVEELPRINPVGITFHYLLPDVDWHNRILIRMESLPLRPLLVADAGYMYAAKMSGYGEFYDLFTPDIGELAFLADSEAPHPFYTRNFLLAGENNARELIARAYAHGNVARHLLVKGKTDFFVRGGEILDEVSEPDVPMLEPVGGTGDTLTGIATALLAAGRPMEQACPTALRANRMMGALARPTPASSVTDLLRCLPEALNKA